MDEATIWAIRSCNATATVVFAPSGTDIGAASEPRRLRRIDLVCAVRGDTVWQHLAEIAKDHQNGMFAGTNDLVEKIGGQRPIGLPEFLEAHRVALLSQIREQRSPSALAAGSTNKSDEQ